MSQERHLPETETAPRSGKEERRRGTKSGVLLLNLGTPDAPDTKATRKYLKEFLSDPRVMDISPLGRYLLLRLIILPFRPSRSAEAYRSIWTDEGSPILVYGRQLTDKVQQALQERYPDAYDVRLGMRYGNPSIQSVLQSFQDDGIDRILVFAMYPQYASATVGSTLEEVYRAAGNMMNVPELVALPVFYNHPAFVDAWRQVVTDSINDADFDHFLFSFHGLPERQIRKSDLSGGKHCLMREDCCEKIGDVNRFCYRAHCLHTARAIANSLKLPDDKWTLSFQSRLGRDPWLRPYTDQLIREFPSHGVKRLAILSPAFVADCLETLEELGMQGVEEFLANGGEECVLVPSLNVHPAWVKTIVDMIQESDR